MDGRINNGGAREGAGRKPKADEERIRGLSINALKSVYGSEEEAFIYLSKQSKESFPHLRLLFEYAYGKPKDSIDLTSGGETINRINTSKLSKEQLLILKELYVEDGNTEPSAD